jgi:hypothetical protein
VAGDADADVLGRMRRRLAGGEVAKRQRRQAGRGRGRQVERELDVMCQPEFEGKGEEQVVAAVMDMAAIILAWRTRLYVLVCVTVRPELP